MRTPAADGFFMPAEWAPHKRCWMAWPCRESLWGDHLEEAREAYASVAETIAEFEPVTMVARPGDVADVSLRCGPGVSSLPMELDDSWMRDTGPTFVTNASGAVAGVDWRFNGWGEKYTPYDHDSAIARALLEHLGLARYEAPLVLEGGSIHVDGEGTLITTEQCLLNPNRNPALDKAQIEDLLRAYLGVETIVWLGNGLVDDETDGHVDNLACFARPGVVLALTCNDPEDANYEALQDNLARLRAVRDAKGRKLEIVEIEQPSPVFDDAGRRLAMSYINFYIANGGVVMPLFEDSRDDAAFETVSQCFPDRQVRRVNALGIVRGGGGIHCITQQQPAAPGEE